MKRRLRSFSVPPIVAVFGFLFAAYAQGQKIELPPVNEITPPMILERLGEFRRDVATDSEEARRWFNQGMALMLGYNFDGAISSFREATRIDPTFAMAWWGIGYSCGPNQNNPQIDKPKDDWSFAAARKAYELRERERALG